MSDQQLANISFELKLTLVIEGKALEYGYDPMMEKVVKSIPITLKYDSIFGPEITDIGDIDTSGDGEFSIEDIIIR